MIPSTRNPVKKHPEGRLEVVLDDNHSAVLDDTPEIRRMLSVYKFHLHFKPSGEAAAMTNIPISEPLPGHLQSRNSVNLHSLLSGAVSPDVVWHKNGNSLDCTVANMEIVSLSDYRLRKSAQKLLSHPVPRNTVQLGEGGCIQVVLDDTHSALLDDTPANHSLLGACKFTLTCKPNGDLAAVTYLPQSYPMPAHLKARNNVHLHSLIVQAAAPKVVWHINGNTLDCRMSNLEVIDVSELRYRRSGKPRPDPASVRPRSIRLPGQPPRLRTRKPVSALGAEEFQNRVLARDNGTIQIELTQGKSALLDDTQQVQAILREYLFAAHRSGGSEVYCATTNIPAGKPWPEGNFDLHILLLSPPTGARITHLDGDRLNYRLSNLELIPLWSPPLGLAPAHPPGAEIQCSSMPAFERGRLYHQTKNAILFCHDGIIGVDLGTNPETEGRYIMKVDDTPEMWATLMAHHVHLTPSRYASISDALFHHIVQPRSSGMVIDHINRDRLDNRKANLRLACFRTNAINRSVMKNNTSGVPGVGRMETGHSKGWIAVWETLEMGTSTRYFSDARYGGSDRAKEMAVLYRSYIIHTLPHYQEAYMVDPLPTTDAPPQDLSVEGEDLLAI